MKGIAHILIIASTLLAAACSTVNTVERAEPLYQKKMVNDRRIITDGGLNDSANVKSVNEARVGGLLKIQAQIENLTSSPKQINYKFSWIDKGGMEVPSATSNWNTLILEGRESKYISAVAPTENVCDFTLKLLENVRD